MEWSNQGCSPAAAARTWTSMKNYCGSLPLSWSLGWLWERDRIPRRVHASLKIERDGPRRRKVFKHLAFGMRREHKVSSDQGKLHLMRRNSRVYTPEGVSGVRAKRRGWSRSFYVSSESAGRRPTLRSCRSCVNDWFVSGVILNFFPWTATDTRGIGRGDCQ
jgi:hypothetical protein